MATIDSGAPWSDGGGGCRNQRAPRIADIQRHKAMEGDRVPTVGASNSNSSTTSSTSSSNVSSTITSPIKMSSPENQFVSCCTASSSNSTKDNSNTSNDVDDTGEKSSQQGTNKEETKVISDKSPSSLPRKFEQLQLNMSSDSTISKDERPTSDTSSCICKSSKDSEGIVKECETFNSSSSPQNSHVIVTTSTTNCFAHMISKCLSLSSSTTTITSSSSPTSSMLIDSSSVSMVSVPSSSLLLSSMSNKRPFPKTQSLDLVDNRCRADHDDTDADVDDDEDIKSGRRQPQVDYVRRDIQPRGNEVANTAQKGSQTDPPLPSGNPPKAMIPKMQSLESRPIYPNVPYSPYASPYGSPRSNRRRTPLRESRRISIEQSGSFLQLNQYKLMDQIGQGSYGLVKLAYNEEDSTHYAMKILSKRRLLRKAGLMGRGPKKTTSPLDRVYREIAVLKKLDHPNVVKLVEVLDDPLEDSLYLVFELVQQGEVLSIPAEKPLSEERSWCVFRDALQGLEYLHYQRIIHGDIKPGNLLLGEFGRVKIADLGVCNEFFGEDAAINNGATAGTPAFRAPETLIPGQHLYSGKAADIWALGATLYTLVYGTVPFVASSVLAVYEKIKNDQLKLPETPIITPELRDLIEKILTKDPSRRITLPQIKEHPWVTAGGSCPLPSEEENCRLVQISDEDIHTVVKSIPKLDTLILIKTMLKNHSFQNPFSKSVSGRAPQRGGSRLERFTRSGRSNSAPGAYHMCERQLSSDSILPAVSETVASSCNESSDQFFEG